MKTSTERLTASLSASSRSRPKPEHEWRYQRGDDDILRAITKYVYLTVDQAALLLDRNKETIQKSFNKFWRLHILNREQENDFTPFVYFRGYRGAQLCQEKGFSENGWYIREKSKSHIPHDLFISEFHLRLELAVRKSALLHWEQWRDDMRDMKPIIPDARFAIEGEQAFTPFEYRRSRPKAGYKTILDKMKEYDHLGVKRVCWIFPTPETCDNILKAAQFFGTNHWFATQQAALADPLGKIWRTPANYKDRVYSLLKPTDN